MVHGRWKPNAPVTLELPDGELASIWDEIQDILPRRCFRQVDEVVQTTIIKTDDPDLFDIKDLELALGPLTVYFPSEGRYKSDSASYLRICLLLGKLFDKMCPTRLMNYLESNDVLYSRHTYSVLHSRFPSKSLCCSCTS